MIRRLNSMNRTAAAKQVNDSRVRHFSRATDPVPLLALRFLGVALLAGSALVKEETVRTFVFLSALATTIIQAAVANEGLVRQTR
jgi:uncharacterized membrane protein YadS